MSNRSLTSFKVLSFDCYGTLIDWESGIFRQLRPLLDRLPEHHPFRSQATILARFNKIQLELQRDQPRTLYSRILSTCYERLAAEAGVRVTDAEADEFGLSIGQWEAFPDTVAALQQLRKHYKLVILSNVDNFNLHNTITGPLAAIEFDAILTAQDIGSYKPDRANFQALIAAVQDRFNLGQDDLLHVAKSLPIDHVPAKEMDVASAWIARGEGGVTALGGRIEDFCDSLSFNWRFQSLSQMASKVEHDFASEECNMRAS